MLLISALLASPASAAPDSSIDVVRDLALRVGPIVGGALACRNIVRSRLQIVPAVAGHSTLVLDHENALAKYFAGKPPDYTSLEGYVSANVPIEALKQVGPQLDTERVVESLEAMNNFDLGIWSTLSFGHGERQASHKIWGNIWGTATLDEAGIYQPIDPE
jgi:branched-chain amino acid transport system substrate-binding protein